MLTGTFILKSSRQSLMPMSAIVLWIKREGRRTNTSCRFPGKAPCKNYRTIRRQQLCLTGRGFSAKCFLKGTKQVGLIEPCSIQLLIISAGPFSMCPLSQSPKPTERLAHGSHCPAIHCFLIWIQHRALKFLHQCLLPQTWTTPNPLYTTTPQIFPFCQAAATRQQNWLPTLDLVIEAGGTDDFPRLTYLWKGFIIFLTSHISPLHRHSHSSDTALSATPSLHLSCTPLSSRSIKKNNFQKTAAEKNQE